MVDLDRDWDEMPIAELQQLDALCDRFEQALGHDPETLIEPYIADLTEPQQRLIVRELVRLEVEHRRIRGHAVKSADYAARFPQWAEELIELTTHTKQIGRYRLEQMIGHGAFGVVYRAYDEQLDRVVAVKLPHQGVVATSESLGSYLSEAQMAARLDHPHIVPVYDFGSGHDVPCFIVSKFIDGSSLSARMMQGRLDNLTSARIVAAIADALQAAHRQGLVHRDVKPGNILIDSAGEAWLTDFGLALREENIGKGPKYAGTPAYMSPEQARGEEHRVDGRSDIYNLGAVLYELLTGHPPFRASTRRQLLERIATSSPRPLRQYDEGIPKELERICLKALSRRVNDRYETAHDLAEDLNRFVADTPLGQASTASGQVVMTLAAANGDLAPTGGQSIVGVGVGHRSECHPVKIVPRGLSSFDEHDADFFVDLLPGPRDRTGLPDSIRFWKTRIEEADADKTFSVGLIYGPSGCGKSSLIKAGLLPRLAPKITAIYVEANHSDTESRLLRRLRREYSGLPEDSGLTECLASVRRTIDDNSGGKLLIVLDQFEQWLHAMKDVENAELVQALRHCDGDHLQCLVMVRDDFWLAVSRFMRDLEVDVVPGRNVALVDLFTCDHARSVLTAFGRALGRLPDNSSETSSEQKTFLSEAVTGLSEDRKVISVRLSLFAEMMKAKPWTPAALKQIGGAAGIGVAFLEYAFSSATAIPNHRMHQAAARRVLAALLPESGTDIKGHKQSSDELLVASGYGGRSKDFDELIRILDGELRLITPTDSYGDMDNDATGESSVATRYYQLTHDYLVPSLREWLTQKQRETLRGRVQLLLAERFALWSRKPERRNLPSAWEWLKISVLTDRRRQTPPQRQMLRHAVRVHGLRWGIGLATALVVAIATLQWSNSIRHRNLLDRMHTAVDTVANSNGAVVPIAIENLKPYPRQLVVARLQTRFAESNERQQLALAYALARYGKVETDFLVNSIGTAPASEVNNLAAALAHAHDDSVSALRRAAEVCETGRDWIRKHRLAVVALYLGEASIASDMCQLRPDRIQRLDFVSAWSSWHGDPGELAQVASQLRDSALQSGLLAGLGAVRTEEIAADSKQAWLPVLTDWFQHADDAAVHSATDWLLRKWRLEIPYLAPSGDPVEGHYWQVTKNGMSMIRVPAGAFQRRYGRLSSRTDVPEFLTAPLQTVTLTRPILMSDREVSVRQFQQMMDDTSYNALEKAQRWTGADSVSSPTPDHPVQNVNWNDAVRFCNWLSHTEGLPPAYERTGKTWTLAPEGSRSGDFEEWQLVEHARGYRLPTSAEWEYACRAGSDTQDPFGDEVNERFLRTFASAATRVVLLKGLEFNSEKCGSTPPNAWGLFDLHGNVREWVQDWNEGYLGHRTLDLDAVTDPTGPAEADPQLFKQIRNGIFYRSSTALVMEYRFLGFRVVRTI